MEVDSDDVLDVVVVLEVVVVVDFAVVVVALVVATNKGDRPLLVEGRTAGLT